MSIIAKLLDRLHYYRCKALELTGKIEAYAPDELVSERNATVLECEGLETLIKDKARHIARPHTLIGKFLQLVWTRPRPRLNQARVGLLVDRYNELLRTVRQHSEPWALEAGNSFRLTSREELEECTTGYWSIRARGK
jgi:hypothetical protein